MNQPDMAEIVGHLVDEERLVAAKNLRFRQIARTQLGAIRRRHLFQGAGVARMIQVRITTLQLQHHARNFGQFLGAFDQRMRGQNLLQKRGAGARQAQDKNRVGPQIAPAGANRLWAEPETGGEAYIPLALNKRARSTAILDEVSRQFGKPGSGTDMSGVTAALAEQTSILHGLGSVIHAELQSHARTTQMMRRQG